MLFIADFNRYMYAFDLDTGKILWQTRLASSGHGFPLSYAVNGRQYVAMPVGAGDGSIGVYGKQILPEIALAKPGNSIVVFSLPAKEAK